MLNGSTNRHYAKYNFLIFSFDFDSVSENHS